MFTIEDIIRTLNEIEVKGRDNLDKLLGAIMALEFMQKAQENAAADVCDTEAAEETEAPRTEE